jgi:hypothetical protein
VTTGGAPAAHLVACVIAVIAVATMLLVRRRLERARELEDAERILRDAWRDDLHDMHDMEGR